MLNLVFKKSADKLATMCRLLGTLNDDIWPNVTKLPYWNTESPKFTPIDLSDVVPGLDDFGCDLLSVRFAAQT